MNSCSVFLCVSGIMYIRRRIRKSIPTWHQARYQGSSSLVPARGFGGRKTSRHLESEWEDAKSTNLWGNMKSKIITSSLGIWSCLSLAECFPEFYCYGNTGEWEQENNWKWNIQRKNVFIWKKKNLKMCTYCHQNEIKQNEVVLEKKIQTLERQLFLRAEYSVYLAA